MKPYVKCHAGGWFTSFWPDGSSLLLHSFDEAIADALRWYSSSIGACS